MSDNSIKTEDDIEVYEDNIYNIADVYIESLSKPESINNNSSIFAGMLKFIYRNVFKHNKLDYSDIELLDNVWDVYTDLCYKYGKHPTLLNFSLMTGIHRDTFQSWKNGEYRDNGNGTKSAHSVTVRKWMQECESAMLDGATEKNSIGCIFALKANYGYTEQPQRIEIVGTQQPVLSTTEIEQIAAEMPKTDEIAPDF